MRVHFSDDTESVTRWAARYVGGLFETVSNSLLLTDTGPTNYQRKPFVVK